MKTVYPEVNEFNDWLHQIILPDGSITPGREHTLDKLKFLKLPKDFSGKNVLDIGCRDGFFSFEAEKRGASKVVSIDVRESNQLGFFIAKKILNSKCEFHELSVYDIEPSYFGSFDIVFFFGVLYHLKHPLLALERITEVCNESVFVESHVLDRGLVLDGDEVPLPTNMQTIPLMQYYPNNELRQDLSNWWAPNMTCLKELVRTVGFSRVEELNMWGSRGAVRGDKF